MSPPSRSERERLARVLPRAWQTFLRSGEYAGARASIQADGSEVPVDLMARLEFEDDSRLTIRLVLADRAARIVGSGSALVHLLTARERAVIALIATGGETQDIAETLHVSPATVRTHVRNSMAKVGARTRAQLVAVAMAGLESVQLAHPGDGGADKSSI
jgi:DNA-binding NarL/FixJ family response regulator